MSSPLKTMLAFLVTAAAGCVDVSVAVAQPPESERDAATSQPDPADVDASDAESAESELSPTSLTVTPAGIQRHVSGRWATVAVNGINRTDDDVEATAAAMIGDVTNLQFARRLWIPAGAKRQSWMSVQIPDRLPQSQISVDLKSIHLKQTETGEQFQANVVGMPTSRRSLLLSWEESRTAVMIDSFKYSRESQRQMEKTSDLIYEARDSVHAATQDLGLASLAGSFLPPTPKSLDAVDQLVISSDRILHDTAAASRIRSWLYAGGRIWIMADQMNAESVRELLGDAACYTVVDRVELNDFEIEQVAAYAQLEKNDYSTWSSETPVSMARVLVDTEDVPIRVNGWPAAFWKPVGNGEVLFTTLGIDGWLDNGEASRALRTISSRFFVNRIEPPTHNETLVSFLDDEIGYAIPSRASVAGVLIGHMMLVLVIGILLVRRRKLHHLAMLVPAAALVATGALVAMGNQQTAQVPSTIATAQIARMSSDSSEVQVRSLAAVYTQEGRTVNIRSSPETTTTLGESETTGGSVRRILWDDSGQAQWLFVDQPPGVVRYVESESIVTLPQPWKVEGKFTERGFEGRVDGLHAEQCEDAVIVSPTSPALALSFDGTASTRFTSGFDAVMATNQYIDDKLMSDVQRDRQQLLRQIIASDSATFGREPSLLAWTRPIDSGVTFDDDFARRGSTLASIPIRFQRLASGARFKVPASFTRLEAHAGARGMTSVYNTETGRWIDESNKPAEPELRCLLPKTVLPCRLERATILVKINAPSRTLEVKGFIDDQSVTLHRRENPNGLLQFEIDRPGALRLDSEGGLLFALAISETEEERRAMSEEEESETAAPSRSTWNIDYVHVHLEGTTL